MSEVIVCRDRDDLNVRAAEMFIDHAARAIAAPGRFSVALSGGSTPKLLFELLSADSHRDRVAWDKVHIFWGDERSVAPDHKDSNYRMASEALLTKVPVPAENVHRMRGEDTDIDHAAEEYEADLRKFFGTSGDEIPSFDLVLLGMGDDGHTASLFPGTLALGVTKKLVTANFVEKLATHRITFTVPLLNNAAAVAFLVSGDSKKSVLKEVLEGPLDSDRLPSQLLREAKGNVYWLVDEPAAAELSKSGAAGAAE